MKLLILGIALTLRALSFAASPPFFVEGKYLISGYDPVSYINGKVMKGEPQFSTVFKTVNVLFQNEKNKITFLKNPEKF